VDRKLVSRLILRMCRSLSITLTPSNPEDVIANYFDKISKDIPECPQETVLRSTSLKLLETLTELSVVSSSRSNRSAALVCCFFVLKSKIEGISLRMCIRAVSLGNSEKSCYRDHKLIKEFLDKAMKLGNYPDLHTTLENIDHVVKLFKTKVNIRDRLVHA